MRITLFSTPHGGVISQRLFMKGLRDRGRDDVASSLKLPRNVMACIKKGHGPGKSVKSNIGLAERITSM